MTKIFQFILICIISILYSGGTKTPDVPTGLLGNFYELNPGLFSICNQIPESIGTALTHESILYDYYGYSNRIFPLILNARVNREIIQDADSFKYCWTSDTIVCINMRDPVTAEISATIFSTFDEVSVRDLSIPCSYIRHTSPFISVLHKDALFNWNEFMLKRLFPNEEEIQHMVHGGMNYIIMRLIIRYGKIVDLKYKNGIRDIITSADRKLFIPPKIIFE